MAKLFFRYSTVGAGKSLEIFRIADNYKRQGKEVLCFVPDIVGKIKSRTGLETPSIPINKIISPLNIVKEIFGDNELQASKMLKKKYAEVYNIISNIKNIDCILVDEAQFLSESDVITLSYIVDSYNVPVICYGLKNDFQNNLFAGSKYLLLYADKIEEIKTTCHFCNRKAIMVLLIKDGKPIWHGKQIQIEKDGEKKYLPVCRKHWYYPEKLI